MVTEADGDRKEFIYITGVEGLVAGAQMGVLEFHIWGAPTQAVDRPDRMVMDLDPGDGVGYDEVCKAAFDLRAVLAAAGLQTFPMLTGGKGVHVIAPLSGAADWDTVKSFSANVARALAAAEPHRFVAKMLKAERKGRIFIDWMRNIPGATAIAPFSPRARSGATVAVPIRWSELRGLDGPAVFTVANVPRRLASLRRDPWDGYFRIRQTIEAAAVDFVRRR
jgi:bifunctional non-homologous end joining protein LigD